MELRGEEKTTSRGEQREHGRDGEVKRKRGKADANYRTRGEET